jgi:hypothetical protein
VNRKSGIIIWVLGIWTLSPILLPNCSYAQLDSLPSVQNDSVLIPAGYVIVFRDTLIPFDTDTILWVQKGVKFKIRKNPYKTSANFYNSIDQYSDKKKVTKLLANAIFRMSEIDPEELEQSTDSESPFGKYQGRVISDYRIIQVPLLEGSVDDTLRQIETGTGRLLDKIHIETWESVIRKNLFFEPGDTVDAFLLADNERILRQYPFLKDARIVLVPVEDSMSNDVEALIITQDVFSIGFGFGVGSLSDFDLSLYDLNFLGLGHEFRNVVKYKSNKDPVGGYFGSYKVNNIRGSFIDFLLIYNVDFEKEEFIPAFHKGFLTPQMKFGGGLEGGYRTFFIRRFDTAIDEEVVFPVKDELFDFWAGRQFQVSKADPRKNLIFSGRVARFDFVNRPTQVKRDTLFQWHDSQFVLGSITYKKVNYQKTSLIYRFGIPEDVPYGYVFEITGGYQVKEFFERPYFGIRSGFVIPINGRYLSNGINAGSFFNAGIPQEGKLSYKNIYISRLNKWGRYRSRFIFSFEYIYGINRLGKQGVTLDRRLRGFPSASSTKGTQLTLLRMELDLFTPWYFYGFKTVWFFYGEGALLGNENDIYGKEYFFGSFGTGIRIRNENLVFSTINIRLSYYANVPPGASNLGYEFSTSNPNIFRNINFGKPVFFPFE